MSLKRYQRDQAWFRKDLRRKRQINGGAVLRRRWRLSWEPLKTLVESALLVFAAVIGSCIGIALACLVAYGLYLVYQIGALILRGEFFL